MIKRTPFYETYIPVSFDKETELCKRQRQVCDDKACDGTFHNIGLISSETEQSED